jgi:sulfur carrier protein ThiS
VKVHLEYTGVLDVKSVPSGSQVDLPDHATIGVLLSQLQIRPEHQRFVVSAVNGKQQRASTRLADGDRVLLSLPMGGG